jgi:predicted  nucleic acid-binding Zn-ribbon protein
MGEETAVAVAPVAQVPTITHDDLNDLRRKFQEDIAALHEQIGILQARAAALEGQLARIEPMVEARASKTEKLVMELQVEMRKLTKALDAKEAVEVGKFTNIEGMLKTLLERSE